MLRILLLISVAFVVAKENFQAQGTGINVTNLQAFQQCVSAGLCGNDTGCCSGHGICQYNGTGSPVCVCFAPQECRKGLNPTNYPNYTGPLCSNPPTGCCTSGSDDLIFAVSGSCHLDNSSLDPEYGSWGNLLKRTGGAYYSDGVGAAYYSDGVGAPAGWNKTIDQMVAALNTSNTSSTFTSGNMLGLGLLEFAIKDIVDYEYNYSANVTFYGVTYPKIKWQSNTGTTVGSVKIPKQFANNATAVIDVGPLYDYAHRIGNTPYLNLTDALVHWNAHHMSFEFLVALRLYAAFHYYAARSYEEYFCGQNSTVTALTNVCSNRGSFTSDQANRDWIFGQARRSTIRFSQSVLQQGVLQILLQHPNSTARPMDGYWDPTFNHWFRRDLSIAVGNGFVTSTGGPSSVRAHQEWNDGDVTRNKLSHHLISGLDFLLSLRNPNINTSASQLLNQSNCAGDSPNYLTNPLPYDVISLVNTPLQPFGSKISAQYNADLAHQLYMSGELGLPSYKTHVAGLTSAPNVSDLSQDYNVYFGAQIESNPARQYYTTIASIAMAAIVPVSDATIVDRVSYWHYNSTGWWTANNFHPDPQFLALPAYGYTGCYQVNSSCTVVSTNAASVVLGYNTDMNILRGGYYEENPAAWRSQGCTFPEPPMPLNPATWYSVGDPNYPDYSTRWNAIWPVIPEVLNPLFYQFDGLKSLAVKQAGSDVRYLPNQLSDAISTNIGWTDANYDGSPNSSPATNCYYNSIMVPSCTRVGSDTFDSTACTWTFPNIYE